MLVAVASSAALLLVGGVSCIVLSSIKCRKKKKPAGEMKTFLNLHFTLWAPISAGDTHTLMFLMLCYFATGGRRRGDAELELWTSSSTKRERRAGGRRRGSWKLAEGVTGKDRETGEGTDEGTVEGTVEGTDKSNCCILSTECV